MNEGNLQSTVVALYLPQFHPIPENDIWWGCGFTEWTNVARAKPLFRGHIQPNLPADLGFYDLRVEESRIAQAEIAKAHGVDAFCYYHYWFGNGRRLLERPFLEVLESGKPNFPFMLCWANQSWTGVWHGSPRTTLIEQSYPGLNDEEQHFKFLLKSFEDHRYLNIDKRPVFMVYAPLDLPDCKNTLSRWRQRARAHGFTDLFLLAEHSDPFWDARSFGFDAFVNQRIIKRRSQWTPWKSPIIKIKNKYLDFIKRPTVYDYGEMLDHFIPSSASDIAIPCALPNWDNTPRSKERGVVLTNSHPEKFGAQLDQAFNQVKARNLKANLIFIKSWNEWAEGNHLEPNETFGRGYLLELKKRAREVIIK